MNTFDRKDSWMERNGQWANLMMVSFVMILITFLVPEFVQRSNLVLPETLYRIAPALGMLSLGVGVISLFMAGMMARLTDTSSARIMCYLGVALGFVIAIVLVLRFV
jgi:uncharacterized protein YacL